jgi:hypothetical protein
MSLKQQLETIVGPAWIIDNPVILETYARDQSFVKGTQPELVIKPHTVEEVQHIVRIANSTKTPVIPFSSGLNLHGAAVPSGNGIVLDLTRMKNIEINEEDWFVIIEPGVTYEELQDAVTAKGLRLMVPFGVPPKRSVLTSYLERDVVLAATHIEYGNYLIHDTELILPDGELLRTGCWNLGGRPGGFYGPGLNMLYKLWTGAQGTLGIFTKMIISLQHLSPRRKFFFIPVDSSEHIAEVVKNIQRKEIGWECFGLNRFNLAAILNEEWEIPQKFPTAPKPSPALARLQQSLPEWTVIIGISGSPYFPEERIAYEEEALHQLCCEMKVSADNNFPGFQNLENVFLKESLRPWSILKKFNYRGSVHDVSFKVPLNRICEVEKAILAQAQKYNYLEQDIGGYFVAMERGRAIHCEFDLHCEFNDTKQQVRDLWLAASKMLMDKGALFDRPYGDWAEMVYARAPQYALKLKQLKQEMDPKGILNPGKLCF